jgi:hypothetical protein
MKEHDYSLKALMLFFDDIIERALIEYKRGYALKRDCNDIFYHLLSVKECNDVVGVHIDDVISRWHSWHSFYDLDCKKHELKVVIKEFVKYCDNPEDWAPSCFSRGVMTDFYKHINKDKD